ncbi:hypothetical protein [Terrimonas pollutisoli]|uniref:hypothetical protein n=1 Tax=Terrimonas pollutisoli TaxID=3034147 RepID=UPI0023EAFCCC|nr:hypothetical protein [Terrimonas sp. H1YJ31]
MRLKLFPITFVFASAIAIVMSSCAKDGDQGPAGAAGPAGPAGPAGAAGPAGPAGTANVIYSAWLTSAFKADTFRTTGNVLDTAGFYVDIDAPKLDLAMLDRGEMKVYVNLGTPAEPVVYPLPFLGAVYIEPIFLLNTVEIYSSGSKSPNLQAALGQTPFRYILIPGGTAGRTAPGGKTIDWNNYKEVQAYLGLKD